MRSGTTAIVAATVGLAAWGAFAGIASADPPAPPPHPKTTIDHDGTFAVGIDIVAGRYSSPGPVDGKTCYWKRIGGPDGNEIVANAMSKQPQVVQIDLGDKAFKTDGCQPWLQTDAPAPGGLPALLGGIQLRSYIDTINAGAGRLGAGQVPRS